MISPLPKLSLSKEDTKFSLTTRWCGSAYTLENQDGFSNLTNLGLVQIYVKHTVKYPPVVSIRIFKS